MESGGKKLVGNRVGKKIEKRDKGKEEKKTEKRNKGKEEKKIEKMNKKIKEEKKTGKVAKIEEKKVMKKEVEIKEKKMKKLVKIKETKEIHKDVKKMADEVKMKKEVKSKRTIEMGKDVTKMEDETKTKGEKKVKKAIKIKETNKDVKKMEDEAKIKGGKKMKRETKIKEEMKPKDKSVIGEKKMKKEAKIKEEVKSKGKKGVGEKKILKYCSTADGMKKKKIRDNKITENEERTKDTGLDEKSVGYGWNLIHAMMKKLSKTDERIKRIKIDKTEKIVGKKKMKKEVKTKEEKKIEEVIMKEEKITKRKVKIKEGREIKAKGTKIIGEKKIVKKCVTTTDEENKNTMMDDKILANKEMSEDFRLDEKSVGYGWNLIHNLLRKLTHKNSDMKIRPAEWFDNKPMTEKINAEPEETDRKVTQFKPDEISPDLGKNKSEHLEKPSGPEPEANVDHEVTESAVDETINSCDNDVVQICEESEFEDIGSGDPNANAASQDEVTVDCNEFQEDVVQGLSSKSSSEEKETEDDECEEQSPKHFPGNLEMDINSTDVDNTNSDEEKVVEYQTDVQEIQQVIESEILKETMIVADESSGIDEGDVEPPDLSKLDLPGEYEDQSSDSLDIHTKDELQHQRIHSQSVQDILEPGDDEFRLVFGVLSSLDKITTDYQESISRPATPAIKTNNLSSLEEVEAETTSESDSVVTVIENPNYLVGSKEKIVDFSEQSEKRADGSEEIFSENIAVETLQGQQGSETFISRVSGASGVEKTDKSSMGFFRRQFAKFRKKIRSAWKWIRRGRRTRVGVEVLVLQKSRGLVTPELVEQPAVHWVAATIPL